jgi:hypothetical protein
MERETARHARGHRLPRSCEAASPAYPHPSRPGFSRSRSVAYPSAVCAQPPTLTHHHLPIARSPSLGARHPPPVTRCSTLNCFSHETNTSCERESTVTRVSLPLIHIHRTATHDRNVANSTSRRIPSSHGNSSTVASHALHVGIPRSIAHLIRRGFVKNEPDAY